MLIENQYIFIKKNAFENAEMAAILSRGRWVKELPPITEPQLDKLN